MKFTVDYCDIPDVKLIRPVDRFDERGAFWELFNRQALLDDCGIDFQIDQINQSVSPRAFTVRGLHLQLPPHGQQKLVRVMTGAVFDVAVDVRRGSPSFGKWVGTRLNGGEACLKFVPDGFAHGLVTLEPDTRLIYAVQGYYAPQHRVQIRWDDPDLAIQWPMAANGYLEGEGERKAMAWREIPA